MVKMFMISLSVMFLITGCTIGTVGEGSWEVYGGVRTKQHSTTPSKITIQSSVVDKVVDALIDGEISEEE